MNNIDFDIYITILGLIVLLAIVLDTYLVSKLIKRLVKKQPIVLKSKRFGFKIFALILLNLILPITVGLVTYNKYEKTTPTISESSPSGEGVWATYSDPIEVKFNVPVTPSALSPKVNPDVKGKWVWERFFGTTLLTRKGKFYPEESLFPEQRVVVYISGIRRARHAENHESGFVFDSVRLPEIKLSEPFNKSKDVSVLTELDLFLNKGDEGLQNWKFDLEPKVDFEVQTVNNKQFKLIPRIPLSQSEKYTLTVERQAKRINLDSKETVEQDNYELVNQISFETPKEPLVRSFSPKGTGVKQDAKIRIRFEVPMVRTSAEEKFEISPATEGSFYWDNDSILNFIPTTPLPKETPYKVSFAKGLESVGGGVSEKDISFEFITIGVIQMSSSSPSNGASRISEATDIKVTFDQEVDQASAQSKFQISPGIDGNFRWEGNTMIFDPNGILAFGTNYTVNIASGIKSIFGIDSKDQFSFNFSTRANQVILSVPIYYQPQPSFSCNIYATRMGLAYKGYNIDATSIIAEMGYNDQNVNGQWRGNPNTQYVGTYDGSWGYGVHWDPVQRLFNNRGLATQLNTGWNVRDLARTVENGNPVIIWRYNGVSADHNLNWTAADGTYVNAINGQHGGVITGFRGTSDNPTQFQVNDPWYGIIWIDAGVFDYYWSRLGRVGLVIF